MASSSKQLPPMTKKNTVNWQIKKKDFIGFKFHIVAEKYFSGYNRARTNGQIVLKSTLDIMVARGCHLFIDRHHSGPIYVYLLLKKEVKK